MDRPSIHEFVGGDEAFLAFTTAFHARCLTDPVLEHPFSHPGNPDHVERLAEYWAEVFGGPPTYSERHGGHSAMLEIHARQGAEEDLGERFVAAFLGAADDAGFPHDPEFRETLASYIAWAIGDVLAVSPTDAAVEPGLAMPRWGWNGPA